MQKAIFALGAAAVLLVAGRVHAQDHSYESHQKAADQRVRRMETSEIPSPQFLLYQRAARKAEARATRMEARKWHGISPLRPTVRGNGVLDSFTPLPLFYSAHYYWPGGYAY